MAESITCPKCGHAFALAESVEKDVRAKLSAEFDESRRRADAALAEQIDKVRREASAELSKKLAENRLAAVAQAHDEVDAELAAAQEKLAAQTAKLHESQAKELELIKGRQALEDAKAEFELASARKLDEERSKIRADAETRIGQEHQLKQAEWAKKEADLGKLVEELRRKSEQGSQQAQGEVLELEIESVLKEAFVHDTIEPVAKGVRGSDVVQRVQTRTGQPVGAISWEIKRTKRWDAGWPAKLKDDQRAAKAELAVIITTVLPDDVKHIGQVEGVWVCDVQSFVGLALVLRASLIELAQARQAQDGRKEKAEELYDYIQGVEFRGHVEALVESFATMRDDLEAEKRAVEKLWAKRDKQIAKALTSASRFYGSLQGLAGATLPEIASLTLEVRP